MECNLEQFSWWNQSSLCSLSISSKGKTDIFDSISEQEDHSERIFQIEVEEQMMNNHPFVFFWVELLHSKSTWLVLCEARIFVAVGLIPHLPTIPLAQSTCCLQVCHQSLDVLRFLEISKRNAKDLWNQKASVNFKWRIQQETWFKFKLCKNQDI